MNSRSLNWEPDASAIQIEYFFGTTMMSVSDQNLITTFVWKIARNCHGTIKGKAIINSSTWVTLSGYPGIRVKTSVDVRVTLWFTRIELTIIA